MEENKNSACPNCGVFKPWHVIRVVGIDDHRCVECGLPVQIFMHHSITTDTAKAKAFLKDTGLTMTPDAVRDACWPHEQGHITGATLGRKFRDAANRGELIKSYYINERGTKIAQYSWNKEQNV